MCISLIILLDEDVTFWKAFLLVSCPWNRFKAYTHRSRIGSWLGTHRQSSLTHAACYSTTLLKMVFAIHNFFNFHGDANFVQKCWYLCEGFHGQPQIELAAIYQVVTTVSKDNLR